MPVPTLTPDQVEDIYTTTFNQKLPEVIDNVYLSNPVLGVLNQQERILLDGGRRIEQNIIYAKLPGGSYNRADTFQNARVNTRTAFIIDWKLHRVELVLDGMDELQNAGAMAAFDNADLKMQEAELTLKDNLGGELFGAGINNQGAALNGFAEWVDDGTNYASVGGITRGADAVGTAAKAIYDATGGPWTVPAIQNVYGQATIENEKPNMICTTQPLWNGLFNRVQPQQRYPSGSGIFEDLARIGFESLKFQRAAVVVDSHVPTGEAFGLNTNFLKLIVHSQRPGVLRGWMPTSNKDERVNQLFWAGNLVVGGPRFNFHQKNYTA
jgi:hypothetical protein